MLSHVMLRFRKVGTVALVCIVFVVLWTYVARFGRYIREREEREKIGKYTRIETRKDIGNAVDEQISDASRQRKLPQVIGIGVKKCGTGALRHFLRYHPRVFMAKAKFGEPHFFDNNSTFEKGRDYYLSLMPETKDGDLTMEITPRYFVSEYVPGRIQKFYDKKSLSELKFIVILCNPTERLFSEYVHLRSVRPFYHIDRQVQKYPSASDFASDAIRNASEILNKVGDIVDDVDNREFVDFINRYYEVSPLTNGIYIFHLKRWLKYFSTDQIMIVNGDDLIKRPWVPMKDVQKFLGIEDVITKGSFHFNDAKGFYCLGKCLTKGKGRTRSNNPLFHPPYPPLTAEVSHSLDHFYHHFNERLFQFINKTLLW